MICRTTSLCLLFFLFSPSSQARSPWKPQINLGAQERPGGFPFKLKENAHKEFNSAYRRGFRLLEFGQYLKARKHLQRATRLDPEHVGARRALARTLLTLGYLYWNKRMVFRGLDNIRHAMWLRPGDPGQAQIRALLSALLKRMQRPNVSTKNKKAIPKR
jgi:tetratricopeptide (TPR) repeat protein